MGEWLDNPKSIFDNMIDEEFENTLVENGFKYAKVTKGKGGLIINGTKVSRDIISNDDYEENLKSR